MTRSFVDSSTIRAAFTWTGRSPSPRRSSSHPGPSRASRLDPVDGVHLPAGPSTMSSPSAPHARAAVGCALGAPRLERAAPPRPATRRASCLSPSHVEPRWVVERRDVVRANGQALVGSAVPRRHRRRGRRSPRSQGPSPAESIVVARSANAADTITPRAHTPCPAPCTRRRAAVHELGGPDRRPDGEAEPPTARPLPPAVTGAAPAGQGQDPPGADGSSAGRAVRAV